VERLLFDLLPPHPLASPLLLRCAWLAQEFSAPRYT
jgi:hypothetical protein